MKKLVRDRIPDIIRESGRNPQVRILEDQEYHRCLKDKLDEEVAEFHADGSLEELADILEVVFALSESIGCTRQMLMAAYEDKHRKRGGFSKRIYLEQIQ